MKSTHLMFAWIIGETVEEMILNAKYSISVARKIGACVFLSPADIVEGKVTYDSFIQIIHSRNALVVISYVFIYLVLLYASL